MTRMTSEELRAALKKMNDVYAQFAGSREKIKAEGVKAHTLNDQGIYFIALRHPEALTQSLAGVSTDISGILPSMTYRPEDMHTTLCVLGLSNDFRADTKVLRALTRAVERGWYDKGPTIDFDGLLVNQDSVIAKGIPDATFFEVAHSIVSNAADYTLELRPPWGAHITVARFNETMPYGSNIESMLQVVDGTKLNMRVKPLYIDVGHALFHHDGKSSELKVYERLVF